MEELTIDMLIGKIVLLLMHDLAEAVLLGQAISIVSTSNLEIFHCLLGSFRTIS